MTSRFKRFTRAELMEATGATQEEMADLEARGLVVAEHTRRFLGSIGPRREYFTQGQVDVVSFLVRVRRVMTTNRLAPSGAVPNRTQAENEE